MIKLINHDNNAFFLPVKTEVVEKISGESELKFEFSEYNYNREIVNAITRKWIITNVDGIDDNKKYVVTIVRRESNSNLAKVSVIAKEKQIDDLKARIIYQNITGHYTAKEYFDLIFEDSGYRYELESKVGSLKWENAGDGTTRLENFKKGLERYGLEFSFDSNTNKFHLTKYVENIANYYIKNGTNALNFKLEEDSNAYYTCASGFGNYSQNDKFQNAQLQMEYRHPLADSIGIYEAPPIKDGKITNEKLMRSKLIEVVTNSLKQSLTLDFITLKEKFQNAIAKVGDLVPVKDDTINVFDEIRIIEVKTIRDINNQIVKQDATLGDFKKKDRYLALVNSSVNYVKSLTKKRDDDYSDKDKIKNLALEASKLIGMSQSLNFDSSGLKSINQNLIVAFTKSQGIQISSDYGVTYNTLIDGNGLNMNLIPLASLNNNGLMSIEDKEKLNNINSAGSSNLGSVFYKEVNNFDSNN
ncbi:hypothetical protein WL544_05955 [Staphylococcus epidermidis]|uniref:tail tube TT1 domain-containing protein n=1 Tax=Staphylococcus TaxID=1279 RepID=UPI00026C1563|nr:MULTISPECIES: hypothetical protein [Staphylococcus]ASJ93577.1 hypothetical protein CFE88_04730 [Staphylococcus epidermidis]EJE10402.1 phage minor structural protein, N-terminal domain protein [Staphylococcus epidermidis NIHLM023]KAB2227638.1 hypothetical protein F9B46_02685 [Staphylococcus epidermidis]MBF2136187.1 hypothetical protein [Staphylococcus epidermidis]MBF2163410.1 hypothetical protein [Staphylococcus epidermidis]